MKKKGFTLIELLAVIVVLAIIALIATPIILNIISDSKEESNKRSVELYGSAVKNAVAAEQLKGNIVTSINDIDMNKYYDGNVSCTTIEIYEDGNIYLSGCTVNGTEVEYTYGTRQQLEPGAYDNNNNLVADWDTLISYGLNFTSTYSNAAIFEKEELKNVTKLVISDSVTSIGPMAFKGCTNLTNIIIPDSVTRIDIGAFLNCTSLTDVIIPDSVTVIEQSAFQGCTSLTNIIIPDSVTRIGGGAFANCTNLTNVVIPDSVTRIANGAFQGCTSLTNITIPDSVTSIDGYAFQGCTSLTDVTIGANVTRIGLDTFSGCTNLTSVTFRNPIGWKVVDINTMVETELPELTDPATNATYLKTYGGGNYGWERS